MGQSLNVPAIVGDEKFPCFLGVTAGRLFLLAVVGGKFLVPDCEELAVA